MISLETVDLYGLGIHLEAFLLVDKKVLDVFTLIALKLDHLAHLGVVDDGAIAGCTCVSVVFHQEYHSGCSWETNQTSS
jgi:hypothetical protein